MPSLPDQWIAAEAEDGTKYQKKVTCGVTVEGIFTIGIPEELVEFVKDNGVDYSDRYFNQKGLRYGYFRGNARLECQKLDDGIKCLNECALKSITAEKQTERVIIYKTEIGVSFWLDAHGKMFQNGGFDHPKGGQWWKPKTRPTFRGIEHENFIAGLGAAVFDKTTHKRKSGNKVIFEFVRDETDKDLHALNSFCGASPDPETSDAKEMPYTPEAARFFTATLFAVCNLAKSIDDFFADKNRLQLAITKGSGLLEFHGKK